MKTTAIVFACIAALLLTCAQAPDDLITLPRIEFPLSAPAPSAQAVSCNQIDISWTAVNDATAYAIYRSAMLDSGYAQIGTTGTDSYSDAGLSASTAYYYKVKAINTAVESGFSAAIAATTQAPPVPAAPTGVTATTLSSTSIQISWTASNGATAYAIFRSPVADSVYEQIATQAASPYIDVGLTANSLYYYKVTAINSTGASGYSAEVNATTDAPPAQAPDVPTGVSATSTSSTSIALSWTAVNGATAYIVYRSASSGGSYEQIGTPSSNSFTDVGLAASTPYYYKVSAANAISESDYSSEATATTQAPPLVAPAIPTGVGAIAKSSTSIEISWTAANGATSYQVFRSATSGGTYDPVGTQAASPYTDVGLTPSTPYYYKVKAVNSVGASDFSSEAAATTQAPPAQAPGIPTGVGATAISSTSINVSWIAVSGATSYIVFRSATSGGTYTQVGTPSASPYNDGGLTASTPYYYKVKAANAVGESDYSSEVTATTQAPPVVAPGIPTGVGATATSSTSISVSWTAVSGATSYKVFRSATSGGTYTQVGTPASSPYADAGLTASTAYYYKVSAVNSAGESGQSSYASATTQAPPLQAPGIPTGVGATATSSMAISVSWTAVNGATSYKIFRSPVSGGTYYMQVGTSATSPYLNTGLTASTPYYYKVSAVNSVGESAQSSEATATTPPAYPTGVSATATSSTAISISWTVVGGVTSYKVFRSATLGGTYAQVGTSTTSPYVDAGLTPNTAYYYKVKAAISAGESGFSSEVTATTQVGIPGIPTGVGATATSSTSITVSWTTVSGATSYKVYRSAASGGTYTQVGTPATSPYSDAGLTASTAYYYKVSAVNSAGESGQSSYATATTQAIPITVTDIDGNVYHAVTIGTQVWLVENLKTARLNDGTAIQLDTNKSTWSNLTTPGYCWHNNDSAANKATYGSLYNWYAVNTAKLAPAGWHVPTDAEWTTLTTFLGGLTLAGGKLKEASMSHWLTPNSGATNETGFTALPGGARNPDGTFFSTGNGGLWWSATANDAAQSWYRSIFYDKAVVIRGAINNKAGHSVRCVKD
jgi:titin